MKRIFLQSAKRLWAYAVIMAIAVAAFAGFSAEMPMVYGASPDVYSDVPSSHWAYAAINNLTSRDIVGGTGDGKFSPDGQVTTGQFVTMMTRAFYSHAVDEAISPVDNWWGKNMFVAHLCGMIDGTKAAASETPTANGKVQWDAAVVDAPMDRYEMALVMYNQLDSMMEMPSSDDLAIYKDTIPDYNSIPSRYKDAVLNVYALDCLTGVDVTGRFAGDRLMTRAQAAVVIQRIVMLKETGEVPSQPDATPSPEPTPEQKPSGRKIPADTNGDGILTEAEVTAALEGFKEKYPDGYPWGTTDSYTSPIFGAGIECAGWAFLVSDGTFGISTPRRNVTDTAMLRVGDVLHTHTDTVNHWSVVISTSVGDEFFLTASGNVDGKVSWNGAGEYALTNKLIGEGKATVYTRYPV